MAGKSPNSISLKTEALEIRLERPYAEGNKLPERMSAGLEHHLRDRVEFYLNCRSESVFLGACSLQTTLRELADWLSDSAPIEEAAESEWKTLIVFEPLRYVLYGSIDPGPSRLRVVDAKVSPVREICITSLAKSNRESWSKTLDSFQRDRTT
jgi:hypothetical protein